MTRDNCKAPLSAQHINHDWPHFTEAVQARLINGARVYGDGSFDRTQEALLTEIQAELLDVAGWASIQWATLERLKGKVLSVNGEK